MSKYTEEFKSKVGGMLDKIHDEQMGNMEIVAQRMADTIIDGKSIFVFGPGHAGILTQDMFHRAGGFVLMNPIFHPVAHVSNRPITTTSALEKVSGVGRIVLDSVPIKEGDMLLIHSVAGKIPIVTEMAVEARKRGIYVASIINMDYAKNVTSLDPNGYMLYDVSDIVIDNCGEYGDASILVDGMSQKIASTSTILASFIGTILQIRACELLLAKGFEPPVYVSTNLEGGDEHNNRTIEKYKDRIHYL